MHRAILLASALLVSCSAPQRTEQSQLAVEELAGPLKPPTVASVEFDDFSIFCSVTILNETPVPLRYLGYQRKSIFWGYETWQDGDWVREHFGWCGTGAKWNWLQPGESARLEITLPEVKGPYRVLGSFEDEDGRYTDVVLAVVME